jgi:hypothetical protein
VFDPDCFDFNAYLARRLGVGRQAASGVLSYWVQTYERAERPGHRSESAKHHEAERPSGIHTVAVLSDACPTGTDC